MLYKRYINLFKKGSISTSFSPRFPDYADKYKFNLIKKAINHCNKSTFLDIGAGSGRLSLLLINSNFKSGIALEVAPDNQIWDKNLKQHSNLQLLTGLLQEKLPELSITHKSNINFILLSELFEHIPLDYIDTFIKYLYKILSNNGVIYLTTPNSIVQGQAEQSSRYYKIQEYGHHKHYNLQELKVLFLKHNLKITSYNFESGYIKRNFYNKFFYRISRLDNKLLTTKKLPSYIRYIYKIISYPLIYILKFYFWSLSKVVFFSEQKFNNENNSETIVLEIKKI
jgi:2-polyprenyl-3-methyl-5-hydroxy-6-metoxy-1,4-benzoquinol methylase